MSHLTERIPLSALNDNAQYCEFGKCYICRKDELVAATLANAYKSLLNLRSRTFVGSCFAALLWTNARNAEVWLTGVVALTGLAILAAAELAPHANLAVREKTAHLLG